MTASAPPPHDELPAVKALQTIAANVLAAQNDAIDAAASIEWDHMQALPESAQTRALVALTLLRSSCDIGLAASTLLATNLRRLSAGALVLHRTQIETYARGLFFKSAATDDEIQRFVFHDEMPKRPGPSGKAAVMFTGQVLHAAALAEDMDADKLQSMLDNVWSGLCGVVHGGRPMLHTYGAVDASGVRFNEQSIRALLSHVGAFVVLACTAICAIGDPGADRQDVLVRIRTAANAITTAVDLPAPSSGIAAGPERRG